MVHERRRALKSKSAAMASSVLLLTGSECAKHIRIVAALSDALRFFDAEPSPDFFMRTLHFADKPIWQT
jgi:hypothetical protein